MATKKISDLAVTSLLTGSTKFEVELSGVSNSCSSEQIFNYGIPSFQLEQKNNKNVANGYAGLDPGGKLASSVIPATINTTTISSTTLTSNSVSSPSYSGNNMALTGNGSFNNITSTNILCNGNLSFNATSPNTALNINSCESFNFNFNWIHGSSILSACSSTLLKFGPFNGLYFNNFSGTTHDIMEITSDDPLPVFFRPTKDLYFIWSYSQGGFLDILSYLIIYQTGLLKIIRFDGENFNDGVDFISRPFPFLYFSI